MDQQPALPPSLYAALKNRELVLTGNERAARSLRRRFDSSAEAEGLLAWQPPNILSWKTWTSSLWRQLLLEGHATELLLNRTQEHALWLSILRSDTSLRTLRSLDSLADLAAGAFRLTCAFHGEQQLQQANGGSDARSFRRWAVEFDRTCRSAGFLPSARLEARLTSAIEVGQLSLPSTLQLIGVESRTPAQEKLLQEAVRAGLACTEPTFAAPLSDALLISAQNPSSEILSAARWSRELLRKTPQAKIAILVPSLDEQRWLVDHLFRRVLAPTSGSTEYPLFEFSTGTPLSRMPMISAALDLLQWSLAALPIDRVSALLLSRHFADKPFDRGSRAEFDAHLLRRSRRLRPEITLEQLQQMLGESRAAKYNLPHLRASLRAMRQLQGQLSSPGLQRSYEDWAETIRDYLAAASWAACIDQTPLESEVHRAWQSVLDELATLSFLGTRVSFDEALLALTRIIGATSFHPESHHAPIEIMNPADLAGSTFDAIWFVGATDLAWPPPIPSNPLLPRAMQQKLGIPGADKQLDLETARSLSERIASSGAQVVFSYALEGIEGAQRPSTLLNNLTSSKFLVETLISPETEPFPVPLEAVPDRAAIPPPPPSVPGGARVLELQAACGFRAFAELRLASVELRAPPLGMDARERGSLVHKALETIWQKLPSQAALRNLLPPDLESLLQECAEASLENTLRVASDPWELAYIASQRDRLTALLRHWLQVELARPPFEVLERESSLQAKCGPLLLKLRLDRVDKVADKALLIDYKTGAANSSGWLTERPDAPQLPLYATAANLDALGGLAFAHVRAGEGAKITGIAGAAGILGSNRMEFTEDEFKNQLQAWRRVLTALAEAFYQGDAAVDPKQFPKTCTHCEQRIVCRVDPSQFEQPEQESPSEAHE